MRPSAGRAAGRAVVVAVALLITALMSGCGGGEQASGSAVTGTVTTPTPMVSASDFGLYLDQLPGSVDAWTEVGETSSDEEPPIDRSNSPIPESCLSEGFDGGTDDYLQSFIGSLRGLAVFLNVKAWTGVPRGAMAGWRNRLRDCEGSSVVLLPLDVPFQEEPGIIPGGTRQLRFLKARTVGTFGVESYSQVVVPQANLPVVSHGYTYWIQRRDILVSVGVNQFSTDPDEIALLQQRLGDPALKNVLDEVFQLVIERVNDTVPEPTGTRTGQPAATPAPSGSPDREAVFHQQVTAAYQDIIDSYADYGATAVVCETAISKVNPDYATAAVCPATPDDLVQGGHTYFNWTGSVWQKMAEPGGDPFIECLVPHAVAVELTREQSPTDADCRAGGFPRPG